MNFRGITTCNTIFKSLKKKIILRMRTHRNECYVVNLRFKFVCPNLSNANMKLFKNNFINTSSKPHAQTQVCSASCTNIRSMWDVSSVCITFFFLCCLNIGNFSYSHSWVDHCRAHSLEPSAFKREGESPKDIHKFLVCKCCWNALLL